MMSAANSTTTYGAVTKTFHWLTALMILAVIPLGLIANGLPFDTDAQLARKAALFSYHKTLGVMIFLMAIARILWAVTQTKPGGLHPDRKMESLIAEIVHWTLYIALVAVPLTGWIHHAATTGFAPILLPFGQSLPFIPKSEGLSEVFASLHWIWSKVLAVAILLHIAGALKHHVIDKDATLRRMWFGRTETPEAATHDSSLTAPLAAMAIFALASAAGAAAGLFAPHDKVEVAALETVSSDWVVQTGTVGIEITQLGSPVTGEFAEWTSAITFDPDADGTPGDVTTTIAIGSLSLGAVSGQAMGADFFDVGTFPTASFQAKISANGDSYIADGTLTIKGTAIPVQLPFSLLINGDIATMSGTLSLDRRDFDIGLSTSDPANLGFDVKVNINLTATRTPSGA